MGFFKSIFSSTTLSPEEEKAKEENKNFEVELNPAQKAQILIPENTKSKILLKS